MRNALFPHFDLIAFAGEEAILRIWKSIELRPHKAVVVTAVVEECAVAIAELDGNAMCVHTFEGVPKEGEAWLFADTLFACWLTKIDSAERHNTSRQATCCRQS